MSLLARLEQTRTSANRRNAARRKLRLNVAGATSADPEAEVVIHDLSRTGLLLETGARLLVGEKVELELPEVSATPAKIVWNSGHFYGACFSRPIPKAALSASLLRSVPLGDRAGSELENADADLLLEQALADSRKLRTRASSGWEHVIYDRASLPARMRMLFALTLASWAIISGIAALVWIAL